MHSINMYGLEYGGGVSDHEFPVNNCLLTNLTVMTSPDIPLYIPINPRPPKVLLYKYFCSVGPSVP